MTSSVSGSRRAIITRRMCGRSSVTPEQAIRVLYDGWPLVYAPASGPATHLLELLETLPSFVEPWLALPGEIEAPQPWLHLLIEPIQNGPAGRLRWEQAALSALARRCSAHLLHTNSPSAPLLNAVPCVISPAEKPAAPLPGLGGRLREALGRGGAADACILWPEDLPDAPPGAVLLPPYVHSAFFSAEPTVEPTAQPKVQLLGL